MGKIKSPGPLNLTRNCQLPENSLNREERLDSMGEKFSNNLHLQAFPIKTGQYFLQTGLESGGYDSDS